MSPSTVVLGAAALLALAAAAANPAAAQACEVEVTCGDCTAFSPDCIWCAGVGICLNSSFAYAPPFFPSGDALCTGALRGTIAQGCSGNTDLCGAKYGSYDCTGCQADNDCFWCGIESQGIATCLGSNNGQTQGACSTVMGSPNCIPDTCGQRHGTNCNACEADSECASCVSPGDGNQCMNATLAPLYQRQCTDKTGGVFNGTCPTPVTTGVLTSGTTGAAPAPSSSTPSNSSNTPASPVDQAPHTASATFAGIALALVALVALF